MGLRNAWVLGLLASVAVADEPRTFVEHVRPIFAARCLSCHNADTTRGGLDLSSYSATLGGGSGGEALLPGDATGSRLFELITHAAEPKMPPNSTRIPDAEIEVIRAWIEQGLRKTSSSKALKKRAGADLQMGDLDDFVPSDGELLPIGLPLETIVASGPHGSVHTLTTHPWSPLALLGGQQQVLVYDLAQSELLGVLPLGDTQPEVLRVTHSGKLLLVGGGVGGQRGHVELWSLEEGTRLTQLGEEFDSVRAADIDARQRWVALGGPSRKVRVHSIASGEVLHQIKKHTDWVTGVAFSPDGILLATADRNGGVHVWEAESGAPFHNLGGHNGAVTSLAWRADSDVLATGCADGRIRLWNMHNGRQIRAWNAHSGGVLSLAFARDGRLLSGGREPQARLWAADGKKLRDLPTSGQLVTSVGFDSTGKQAVTSSFRGRVDVFALDDGKHLGSLPHALPSPEARRAELEQQQVQLKQQQQALTQRRAEQLKQTETSQGARDAALAAQSQANQALSKAREDVAGSEQRVKNAQAERTAWEAADGQHRQAVEQHTAQQVAAATAHQQATQADHDLSQAMQVAEREAAGWARRVAQLDDLPQLQAAVACGWQAADAHLHATAALLDRSTERVRTAADSLQTANQLHAELAKRSTQLQQEGAQLGQRLAEAEQQRSGRSAAVMQHEQQANSAAEQVAQAQQQLSAVQQAVAQTEGELLGLSQRTARTEALHAKWQASAMRAQLTRDRETLARQTRELGPLRQRLADAEAAVKAARERERAAMERLNKLPEQLKASQQQQAELEVQRAEQATQITAGEERLAAKQQQRAQVGEDLQSILAAAEREADNEHLQAARKQVDALLQTLGKDEQAATEQLAARKQAVVELETRCANLEKQREEWAGQQETLPTEIEQLAAAAQASQDALAALREESERRHEPLLLAEADIELLQEEYDALLLVWLEGTGR